MDNFAVCHRQLGMSKQVHCRAYRKGTYFELFKSFKEESEGSPPFPRKKIDSGRLWHNFFDIIFTHTEVRVCFFSEFIINT